MDTTSLLSGGNVGALARGGSRLTARERQEVELKNKRAIINEKNLELGDWVSFGEAKNEFPITSISSRGDIYLGRHRLGFHPREIILKRKAHKTVLKKELKKTKKRR